MIHIVVGDDDPLAARETMPCADLEETFDLPRHAAHGHDLPGMADRAREGQVEPHGHIGKGGEQGHQLRTGSGVAFDTGIALFEIERPGQNKRFLAGKEIGQVALEDHHGLGMDGAAQFGFPLQVDDAFMADAHGTGDAVGQAEFKITVAGDRQAVDLTDGTA